MLYVAGIANGTGSPDGTGSMGTTRRMCTRGSTTRSRMDSTRHGGRRARENWRDDSVRVERSCTGRQQQHWLWRSDAATRQHPGPRYLRTGVYVSCSCEPQRLGGTSTAPTRTAVRRERDPNRRSCRRSTRVRGERLRHLSWLHGAFRYETLTPGDTDVVRPATAVFNLSALIRANVKGTLEYQRDLREGQNHSLNALVGSPFEEESSSHACQVTRSGRRRSRAPGDPHQRAETGTVTARCRQPGCAPRPTFVISLLARAQSDAPGQAGAGRPEEFDVQPARPGRRRRHDGQLPEQRCPDPQRVLAEASTT